MRSASSRVASGPTRTRQRCVARRRRAGRDVDRQARAAQRRRQLLGARGSPRRRPPAPRACRRVRAAASGGRGRPWAAGAARGGRRRGARRRGRCGAAGAARRRPPPARGLGRARLPASAPGAGCGPQATSVACRRPGRRRIRPGSSHEHAGEQADREARDRHQREPEQREQPRRDRGARASSRFPIRRHICSGAEMPRHPSALARTVRTASASPRRALVSAGSSDSTRCRTPSCR